MNDIAKTATADRFLKALQAEGMTKSQAGENIGLTAAQVSYLFNEKYWDRLGNVYWDKVLAWANSGYSLKEYPKHRRQPAENVGSIYDKPLPIESPEPNNDEITEVEFEEAVTVGVGPQNEFEELKREAIHQFIINNASHIVTKNDNHFYFMPYWFRDTGQQLELYSLGRLPDDLKEAIKLLRGE